MIDEEHDDAMNIRTGTLAPQARARAWSVRPLFRFFRDASRECVPVSLLLGASIVVLQGQPLDATACLLGIAAGLAVPALVSVRRYLRWLRWTNE
jgi:hypothetical protein